MKLVDMTMLRNSSPSVHQTVVPLKSLPPSKHPLKWEIVNPASLSFAPLCLIMNVATDALIVGIETLAKYLKTRKKWTCKMTLLTDGENHVEFDNWEATANKINDLSIHLTIVYVLRVAQRLLMHTQIT